MQDKVRDLCLSSLRESPVNDTWPWLSQRGCARRWHIWGHTWDHSRGDVCPWVGTGLRSMNLLRLGA